MVYFLEYKVVELEFLPEDYEWSILNETDFTSLFSILVSAFVYLAIYSSSRCL